MLHEMSAPLEDARRTFPGPFASGHLSRLCERFREWPVRYGVEIVAVLIIGLQLTLPATFFRPAHAIASTLVSNGTGGTCRSSTEYWACDAAGRAPQHCLQRRSACGPQLHPLPRLSPSKAIIASMRRLSAPIFTLPLTDAMTKPRATLR